MMSSKMLSGAAAAYNMGRSSDQDTNVAVEALRSRIQRLTGRTQYHRDHLLVCIDCQSGAGAVCKLRANGSPWHVVALEPKMSNADISDVWAEARQVSTVSQNWESILCCCLFKVNGEIPGTKWAARNKVKEVLGSWFRIA